MKPFEPQDHPRVCGEHARGRARSRCPRGSSPRMRGALLRAAQRRLRVGIIPAYAGSTRSRGSSSGRCRDHPRVCGEHSPKSSLRTRHSGIIPAYAGSTNTWDQLGPTNKDHPRVCGEHPPRRRAPCAGAGSSPRMRGAPHVAVEHQTRAGIIPAYAGSTHGDAEGVRAHGDHPRVCGEHEKRGGGDALHKGSSPRMRGAPYLMRLRMYFCGIIPAYAGSTATN